MIPLLSQPYSPWPGHISPAPPPYVLRCYGLVEFHARRASLEGLNDAHLDWAMAQMAQALCSARYCGGC